MEKEKLSDCHKSSKGNDAKPSSSIDSDLNFQWLGMSTHVNMFHLRFNKEALTPQQLSSDQRQDTTITNH
jgi:hypothetical protein